MTEVAHANDETAAALDEVERRRQQALIEGDLDALAELLDDSLVHVHAPGVSMDKPQLLEHTGSRRAYLEITRGELLRRVIGDIAIVTGPLTNRLRTAEGGERTLQGVVTQVLHRDADGTWRYLSFQMTPYGEQAWPALPSQQSADRHEGDEP